MHWVVSRYVGVPSKPRVDKFTLPLNPESKVLGSVVWQSFICHRTGLTLRGLTRDPHNCNISPLHHASDKVTPKLFG